jgi:Mannosyltransferase putative
VLMSSFSEVILMDADVLFMVDPSTLFDHSHYKRFGVLLFRDRQVNNGKDFDFLRDSFPYASDTLRESGFWKETTSYELESGVLVYDKNNPSAFFALLSSCNLGRYPMQTLSEHISYGDKGNF